MNPKRTELDSLYERLLEIPKRVSSNVNLVGSSTCAQQQIHTDKMWTHTKVQFKSNNWCCTLFSSGRKINRITHSIQLKWARQSQHHHKASSTQTMCLLIPHLFIYLGSQWYIPAANAFRLFGNETVRVCLFSVDHFSELCPMIAR